MSRLQGGRYLLLAGDILRGRPKKGLRPCRCFYRCLR